MAWLEIPAIDATRAPARQNRIMRKLVGVISALASADPHNTIYAAAPFAPGSAAMLCAAYESAPGGSRLPAGSSRCPRCAARLVKLAGRPTAHPGAGSQRHYLIRPAGRLSARGVATLIGMCVAGSRVSEAEQAYRSPCSARPARPPSRPSLPRVTAGRRAVAIGGSITLCDQSHLPTRALRASVTALLAAENPLRPPRSRMLPVVLVVPTYLIATVRWPDVRLRAGRRGATPAIGCKAAALREVIMLLSELPFCPGPRHREQASVRSVVGPFGPAHALPRSA